MGASGKDFPSGVRAQLLGAIPLGGAACDLRENAGIFAMIRIYPEPFETLAGLTSAAGIMKMVGFYASLVAIITLTVILIVKWTRARRQTAG